MYKFPSICHVFASGTIVIVLFAFSIYFRIPAEEIDMIGHVLQYQTDYQQVYRLNIFDEGLCRY